MPDIPSLKQILIFIPDFTQIPAQNHYIMTRILAPLACLFAVAYANAPAYERVNGLSGQSVPANCKQAACYTVPYGMKLFLFIADMPPVLSAFLDFRICLPLASKR